ncbi:MAG TPA: DUF4416 family protein [Candidatus Marinimicrobia bacterium]|nr:DUF4416 family protein [Candidatus Neomarinimicrobiota bacterium]
MTWSLCHHILDFRVKDTILSLVENRTYQPVKLFCGIIQNNRFCKREIEQLLVSVWGEIDQFSDLHLFDSTNYYENEMGKMLTRWFAGFYTLISPESLADIKALSNQLEEHFMANGQRCVNIDPGYLDLDKVVLASAKYGRQKIAVGKGIYADPVKHFYSKRFHSYDWSFPDFKSSLYDYFFIELRNQYRHQLRNQKSNQGESNAF